MKRTVFMIAAVLLSAACAQMTWTCATMSPEWTSRTGHASVVFDNKMWLLGGSYPAFPDTIRSDVWHSTDGADWICAIDSAPWGPRMGFGLVADSGNMWLMGGGPDLYNYRSDVWRSSDGSTWVRVRESAPWGPRALFASVLRNDTIWLMGGWDSPMSCHNDVWYSTDGDSWVCATGSAPWQPRAAFAAAVNHDTIWLVAGESQTGLLSDVWYTADGVNWTCATTKPGWASRNGTTLAIFDGRLWVMGGQPANLAHRYSDVWWSYDGVNWTFVDSSDTTEWRPRGFLASVVYDDKMWVMGGDTTSMYIAVGDVWYSPGLGMDETPGSEVRAPNSGATVLRRVPAGTVVFDAMGRRTASPKPGVFFVREQDSKGQGVEESRVRKVVVTK